MALDTARPAEALAAYDEAYQLDPQPSLLYNRGRALQALERYPEALALFERFQKEAPPPILAKVPGLADLLTEVRGKTSVLRLNGEPAGAQIRVRGLVVGQLPMQGGLRVNAGRAELEVTQDGFVTYRATVDLPGNGAYEGNIRLLELTPRGILEVRSSTVGARLTIDGSPYGTLPYSGRFPPGNHRVLVSSDGYETSETTVDIVASQKRELDLALTRTTKLYERWWFWTGVGTVVIGATVAILAVALKPSAEPGSIAPGVIAFPSSIRF